MVNLDKWVEKNANDCGKKVWDLIWNLSKDKNGNELLKNFQDKYTFSLLIIDMVLVNYLHNIEFKSEKEGKEFIEEILDQFRKSMIERIKIIRKNNDY